VKITARLGEQAGIDQVFVKRMPAAASVSMVSSSLSLP